MEQLLGMVQWFKLHWNEIATVWAYIIATASIIVKLTPTLKDDTFLLKVVKFMAKYFALNTNAPTERPK